MKLYENVVIGNFLYGLGHSIGNATTKKRQLSVISLLQATTLPLAFKHLREFF